MSTDELDIVRMERRKVSYATVTANLVHRAFLHHAADDISACLAEIHRLRALVAELEDRLDDEPTPGRAAMERDLV